MTVLPRLSSEGIGATETSDTALRTLSVNSRIAELNSRPVEGDTLKTRTETTAPESPSTIRWKVNLGPEAPVIGSPFLSHSYLRSLPFAVTSKLTGVLPGFTKTSPAGNFSI